MPPTIPVYEMRAAHTRALQFSHSPSETPIDPRLLEAVGALPPIPPTPPLWLVLGFAAVTLWVLLAGRKRGR